MIFASGTPTALVNTIKILIIEDSLGYARFIYELLKIDDPYGFEIFHNVKLESGLDRLQKKDVDIILLDLGLPDSTGLDTLVKVLEFVNNQIPVVIFSNRNDEDYIQEAIKLGAQDYLCKGEFDGRLLRHTLKAAIERKRLITQLELQAEEIRKKKVKYELGENRFNKTIQNLPGLFIIYDADKRIQFINCTNPEIMSPDFSELKSYIDPAGTYSEKNKIFLRVLEDCFIYGENIISEHCINVKGTIFSGTFNFLPVADTDDKIREVIVTSYNLLKIN